MTRPDGCPKGCAMYVGLVMGLFIAIAAGGSVGSGDEPSARPRLLLLGQGPDGHPAGSHEYFAGLKRLERVLRQRGDIDVSVVSADEPWKDGPERLAQADGAVLYLAEGARWLRADPRRHEAFMRLAARGGGLTCLHWAMGTKEAQPIEDFVRLFGACHGGPDRKYKVLETTVRPDGTHWIVEGLAPFTIYDEFYYRLKTTDRPGLVPLLRVDIDGETPMVAWAWRRDDGGRSFGYSGLHFDRSWDRSENMRIVSRGIAWTLKLDRSRSGSAADQTDSDRR